MSASGEIPLAIDSAGHPFQVTRRVPRIPDEFLEAVIYLYPSAQAARDREKVGGTGFLISYVSDVDPRTGSVYAVTNSHVVREAGSPVIGINLRSGGFDTLALTRDDWFHHPDGDDLAVADLTGDLNYGVYQHKLIHWRDMALTHELLMRHNIGPGDEVSFLGRFQGHEGTDRNLPIARFGNVAMMPQEAVVNERGIRQEAFLVEARSLSGFSGSPVFLIIPPFSYRGQLAVSGISHVGHIYVLGVDTGHQYDKGHVRDRESDQRVPDGWYVRLNSGIMTVIPAWRLTDMLEAEDLAEVRNRRDAEWVATRRKDDELETPY